MSQQLLLGMLLGAAGAGLLYLLLTGRLLPRRSDPGKGPRRSTVKNRVRIREVRGPESARAVLNLLADVRDRPGDPPLVVEKRTSPKVTIDINGELHEYNSLDEVPTEFLALIEKARGMAPSGITIEVNGRRYTYPSRGDVPPEFRDLLPPEQVG